MTDLMELLFDFAQTDRLPGCLPPRAYEEAARLEGKHLSALREGLSGEQTALLERYQDACREQRELELEAMFQAGFRLARELLD